MKKYKHLSLQEEKEIINKHFEKRISQTQLAKEYNSNRTSISFICRKYARSPMIKKYQLDDQKIIDLYTKDKKSVLQIANLFGMTPRPIKRRLQLAGVIKRVSKRKSWSKEIPHYFLKMKIWVAKIIERDGMICKWCKVENTFTNRLEANHIIPVREMETPELLFDMDNGITLCRKCHMKVHYHENEFIEFFHDLIRRT